MVRACVRTGHAIVGLFARSVGLPGLAEDARWDELDAELDELLPIFLREGVIDPDVATCATIAGERALAHGQAGRAQRLWTFSAEQWRIMKRPDLVDEVEARLARLTTG